MVNKLYNKRSFVKSNSVALTKKQMTIMEVRKKAVDPQLTNQPIKREITIKKDNTIQKVKEAKQNKIETIFLKT